MRALFEHSSRSAGACVKPASETVRRRHCGAADIFGGMFRPFSARETAVCRLKPPNSHAAFPDQDARAFRAFVPFRRRIRQARVRNRPPPALRRCRHIRRDVSSVFRVGDSSLPPEAFGLERRAAIRPARAAPRSPRCPAAAARRATLCRSGSKTPRSCRRVSAAPASPCARPPR